MNDVTDHGLGNVWKRGRGREVRRKREGRKAEERGREGGRGGEGGGRVGGRGMEGRRTEGEVREARRGERSRR